MTYRNRRHRLLFLVIAIVVRGGAPCDASERESRETWPRVIDRAVVVAVKNTSTQPESWTAALTPLAPDTVAPELVVEPARKESVAPAGVVEFRLGPGPKARIAPGADVRYLLTVERIGTTGAPLYERVIIHVRPAIRLVPQGQAKYVLSASRWIPFLDDWTIQTTLALLEAPAASYLTEARGRPLGVVTATSTNGNDHSAVIRWSHGAEADERRIPLDLDFTRWAAAKMSGTLTLPDGQTRDVVVQTADPVLYPFLTICSGVLAAYAVKRYFSRRRGGLVARALLAATEAQLKLSDERFQRDTAAVGIAGFDILRAWRRFRTDTEADLDILALRGEPLDDANSSFVRLNTAIDAARNLPVKWEELGAVLRQVDSLLNELATLATPDGVQGRPTIESTLEHVTSGNSLRSLEELFERLDQAKATRATGEAWHAAWERSVRLAAIRTAPPDASANVQAARRRLWEGFDATALADVNRLLDEATTMIVDGGGSAPAKREAVTNGVTEAASRQLTSTSEALEVKRQDRLALLVTLALAILTGLNMEYFGKPFGSLADYSRVLAWALSASIAVDVGSLALDRVSSMLTVPSRVVTRA